MALSLCLLWTGLWACVSCIWERAALGVQELGLKAGCAGWDARMSSLAM